MSFTVTYRKFFTVRVKEENTDLPLQFFRFNATSSTKALFENYHLVQQPRANGFDVFYKSYPKASTELLAVISEKVKFTFEIQVTDFTKFQEYEPTAAQLPQFYLANLTTTGAITPGQNLTQAAELGMADLAKFKQQTFTVPTPLPSGNEPSEWRIKEKYGANNVLQTVPVNIPNNPPMPSVYITLNDPVLHKAEYLVEEGPYLLETDKPTPKPVTIYLSNTITQSNSNGVLDIYWNSIQTDAPADTGKEYQIILKPK